VDQSTANLVAAAGGTTAAILVGTTNVAQQFQQALAKVRGEALPCSYEVPAAVRSGQVAIGKVNVEVTPSEGEPAVVPQNQGCNGDGWKYDDPAAPSAIVLCPSTCATLKADLGAKIRVLLGCATVVK
jgi:hypothetical protein